MEYVDPAGKLTGYLVVIDVPAFTGIVPPEPTRRSRNLQDSCSEAFNQAEAEFPCPDGGDLTTEPVCRSGIIATCNTAVQGAQDNFESLKRKYELAKQLGTTALLGWKAKKYRDVIKGCSLLRFPYAVAACVALGIAKIEIDAAAKKKALEIATQELVPSCT